MVNIERDVPIPATNYTRWPWDEMEVGDSFGAPISKYGTLRSGISPAEKRLGRKFICRRHNDGVRVWRTA